MLPPPLHPNHRLSFPSGPIGAVPRLIDPQAARAQHIGRGVSTLELSLRRQEGVPGLTRRLAGPSLRSPPGSWSLLDRFWPFEASSVHQRVALSAFTAGIRRRGILCDNRRAVVADRQICCCTPHKNSPALGTSWSDLDANKGFLSIYWTNPSCLPRDFAAAISVLSPGPVIPGSTDICSPPACSACQTSPSAFDRKT